MNRMKLIIVVVLFIISAISTAQEFEMLKMPENVQTRWASFENIKAEKGEGGKVGKGTKGYPFHSLKPGESIVILNMEGAGIINRIWMTVDDLFDNEEEHRSIKIEMYWDGSDKPAVSTPLEDFFNHVFGRMTAFDNNLFSSPEGQSFMSFVKMPFKKSAKIVITNESTKLHRVFYDVNMTMYDKLDDDIMYFHAYWHRDKATKLGADFNIVPKVEAKGRFLGCNIGVINFHKYRGWWGEGEVKIYLDGDREYPTLVGSGTEDYIGTGWGQGVFHTNYMGSSIFDSENEMYAFYRFHVKDPIYFYEDIKVTIQQMGGNVKKEVVKMKEEGKPVLPVCFIGGDRIQLNFYDNDASFDDDVDESIWTNYYRQDDVCATSYFYLTTPNGIMNRVVSFEERK